MSPLPPCTPESIAAAKDATRLERYRIFCATGVIVTDDVTQLPDGRQIGDQPLTVGDGGSDGLAGWALGTAVARRLLRWS